MRSWSIAWTAKPNPKRSGTVGCDDLDVQWFVEGEGSETEDGNVNDFEETRIYKKEFEAWYKGNILRKAHH